MALESIPTQIQCPCSARLFPPHSGIAVSGAHKPPDLQQFFHTTHSCTQQLGSSSLKDTLARGLLCSKILNVLYPTTTSRANILLVTFKTILQQPPLCLCHCILYIPQPALTTPAKPMPFGPPNTKFIHSLDLHTFAPLVFFFFNSLSSTHFVTQF